jgi:hypothetical protein
MPVSGGKTARPSGGIPETWVASQASQSPRGLGDIDVGVGGAFRDRQRQGRRSCRRAGSPWRATLDSQAKQDSVATQAAVERTGMYSQRVPEGSTRSHLHSDY